MGPGVMEWRIGDEVCALLPGGGYAEYALTPAAHALPVLFAVSPASNGNWMVDTVPLEPGSFDQKKSLPEAWAGLQAGALAAESGVPDFEFALRYGLAAPAGTPPAIVARLNKELNAALAAEDVKTRLATEGADALPGTPEAYAADIGREEKKWGGLVKKLGLKVE